MIRPFFGLLAILFAARISLPAHAAETAPLSASLLDNDVLRLRVEHLTGNFAEEFLAAQPTNKLDGIILDLRSADGDKNADPAGSGFFANKKIPVVILVNGQTRGTAVTLAMDLRAAGNVILVGSDDFAGTTRPDIAVRVSAEDEKNYLANPFFNPAPTKTGSLSVTNELLPFVDHTSEADLVRQRVKDGEEDDSATPRVEPSQPVVRDPALARALDLFKALAALHPARG
ncbi:MAG TPA: hypothetical protein VF492_11865 [Verrucomicrobiae bacterium]